MTIQKSDMCKVGIVLRGSEGQGPMIIIARPVHKLNIPRKLRTDCVHVYMVTESRLASDLDEVEYAQSQGKAAAMEPQKACPPRNTTPKTFGDR